MAIAAIWSFLRDAVGIIPAMLCTLPIPGVSFGIYNSPMLLSIGFLVGGVAVMWWFGGALLANGGIIMGGTALGLWDLTTAQSITASLGMGLMMGSGFGVVVKDILPQVVKHLKAVSAREKDAPRPETAARERSRTDKVVLGSFIVGAALLLCVGLGLSPLATIVVVALGFVTTIMSAQSVGQTGIDPMEIFGLIVLLAVAALGEANEVRLFFVAGVIAIACGLGGDVMSDFKTGQILGTDPRKMWIGQAVGAFVGAAVSVAVMVALVSAYGTGAFGPGQTFVSAQASVVATMVSGIPHVPAFVIGLAVGLALYCLGIPSMMLGLGVYLPLHLSLTAPIGMLAKLLYDRLHKGSKTDELSHEDNGIIIASGLLGGESIAGVIIALTTVISGLMG